MSASEQLEQINNAIIKIQAGAQEYRVGSKTVRKADLGTLYKERIRLEQLVREENTNGGVYVARFDRR